MLIAISVTTNSYLFFKKQLCKKFINKKFLINRFVYKFNFGLQNFVIFV